MLLYNLNQKIMKPLFFFLPFILFLLPLHAQWQELPGRGRAIHVTTDAADGSVWVLGTNKGIYYHNGNHWTEYPGGGRGLDICVYRNTPYVIGLDNRIYQGTGSGWKALPGSGKGKAISIDPANERLWIVGMDNKIYYLNYGARL